MSSKDGKSPYTHKPQSIPLEDLSRPPDIRVTSEGGGESSRAGSQRSGLLGNRQAFSGRIKTHGRYERVLAGGSEDAGGGSVETPHITTPRTAHRAGSFLDDGEMSPVNVGDFQAAMGSVGLTIDTPSTAPQIMTPESEAPMRKGSSGSNAHEGDDYFASVPDDRSPLTDSRFLQPISGSPLPPASGQRHDQQRSTPSAASRGMLGDDLAGLENGRGSMHRLSTNSTHSLGRSLSTSASPLTTAGSMLRKMSQRVVNLSNESDALEPRQPPPRRQATLDRPPEFPAMTGYAHDEPPLTPLPFEKGRVDGAAPSPNSQRWRQTVNPLRGHSLGIFSPENRLRLWLCEVLVHPVTEPAILLLIVVQTVLLTIDSASTLAYGQRRSWWGNSWFDIGLLVLFAIYTAELAARMIVSGFIKNADEYSTMRPGLTFRQAVLENARNLLAPHREVSGRTLTAPSHQPETQDPQVPQVSIIRTFTSVQAPPEQKGHGRQAQRVRLARRAFLRHSFNRLDFLAVVSFWISFFLSVTNLKTGRHVFVFQMLSCLRILRLLSLTGGTSVILRSLKKAAPLLAHVAFLICFFWLLFGIVGVQAFKSSFRRTCFWFGDNVGFVTNKTFNDSIINDGWQQNLAPENLQFCGGHLDAASGDRRPYLKSDFVTVGAQTPKGFLCPRGSLCVETGNPYNGTVSFDNVFQSLQLVFVIMSANTFSDIMYYTTNSDDLGTVAFFAFGVVIMTFWLVNLLVAVITSSFQVIREESMTSAFTTDDATLTVEEEANEPPKKKTAMKRAFDRTYWFWIALIIISLVVQCVRTADSSQTTLNGIADTEIVITIFLLIEMFLRFATDYRNFHRSPRNWVDLGLAIITTIIMIPQIRNSGQPYAWLTFFQIVRIYRVVLAVPITRDLIMTVLGNVSGILNLIVFVFLVVFLASIFAVQILRGALPAQDMASTWIRITFSNIYNAFIGMYQVMSTENWTSLMYNATNYDNQYNVAWIDAIFFMIWYTFANFIILNMFIAVIQENFDVSEDEKRLHQVRAFLQQKEIVGSSHGNLSLSTVFRLGRDKKRHKDPIEYGPATIEMFKDTVVRDFLDEQMEAMDEEPANVDGPGALHSGPIRTGAIPRIWNYLIGLFWGHEPNPFYSRLAFSRAYDDLDPRNMAKEIATASEQRKLAQRQYLQRHPHYNVSLYLFKPDHPLRRFCQRMVGPGRGASRVQGVEPQKALWYTFSFIIYAFIVAMVLLACITTPLYQRDWFQQHGGYTNRNWFVWTDLAFAGVFTIEAAIKIIADGLLFTPNAYFGGTWGLIDGIVLLTLWISVITSLSNLGQVSRAVNAFKALRALRLLNVSDNARDTFQSVIIIGGWKVISAAFVSLSLLIPFAIYGLNLFHGQFLECNDSQTGIDQLTDCIGEYPSSPFDWTVLAPRAVSNPYFNFDSFGSALSILFQIVSQEGWTDVMWQAMSMRGVGLNPQPFASQGNAVFFIIFNLLGTVFVLTLFISVFMRNYTEQTGVAFLTAEQRSWLELRKLLRQISPSKRPNNRPDQSWKNWCYKIAIQKHGKWQKAMTWILVVHLILLALEFYPDVKWWESLRFFIFFIFTLVYIVNIVIRVVGLTWRRFRRSSWDLYSIIAVAGAFVTSFFVLAHGTDLVESQRVDPTSSLLHKLFLVSIALLLIPRNNELDQLFKTAAASFTAIANLLATWFVLFLVFAIAMTQTLGLTRFASLEDNNLNLRSVAKALVLLFRMSCGEGWNQIMEDFASVAPPFCVSDADFFESDCGSAPWARTLFILWNILSMYIFVSLFVSLVFESFSYVYQRSSGLSVLSRDEIRRFKQAWATFDPDGTGYIPKEAFPKLLGELSGIFEMRIYDGEHTVNQILEHCRVDTRGLEPNTPGVVEGVDIDMLNQRLKSINVPEIRRRRARLNIFSQEVLVSADPDRGVSFASCLMILAHYNIISDSKSLRLEEFLRRRYRLQRVEEEVRRRIVIGFFDTLYWSRQHRRKRELRNSARMVQIPTFAVPEIYVDDPDAGPTPRTDAFPADATAPSAGGGSPVSGISPKDASHPHAHRPGLSLDAAVVSPTSPSPTSPDAPSRHRGYSFTSSPTRSEGGGARLTPGPSPTMRPRRPSDVSDVSEPLAPFDGAGGRPSGERSPDRLGVPPSPGGGLSVGTSTGLDAGGAGGSVTTSGTRHRRQQSSVGSQHMTALEAFDNSAWGESIRKSFTVRRSGTKGRGRLASRMDRMDG